MGTFPQKMGKKLSLIRIEGVLGGRRFGSHSALKTSHDSYVTFGNGSIDAMGLLDYRLIKKETEKRE